jgi:hypothetical protein
LTLIFVSHFNPRWIRIYKELAAAESASGSQVLLVDIDAFSASKRRTAGGRLRLRRLAKELGVGFITLRQICAVRKVSLPTPLWLSEVQTKFRDINPSGISAFLYKSSVTSGLKALYRNKKLMALLKRSNKVFISNGRFATQRALVDISSQLDNLRQGIFFLETGLPNNPAEDRFFCSKYPIHDRINRQNQALEWLATNDPDFEKAREWLRLRATPDSTSNVFSRGWQPGISEALRSRNVFFTSSTDEYWALGGSWHLDSWKDQYEAFGEVLAELERIGDLSATLRIHPNLLNKSFRFVKSELKNIDALRRKFPWLKVVLPHEAVDSYELLSHADRVFVSMSTIGLEASAAGKPVWCTSPTNYDEVADVRKLWDRVSIRDGLSAWEVNASRALGLIAWTIQEGRVYQYSNRLDAGPLDWLPTPTSLPQKIFFQSLFKVQKVFALRASKGARMHRDGHSRVEPRRG